VRNRRRFAGDGPARRSGQSPARKQRISIALSTYNGERFLREQLVSIAHQARPPDELVIRDDHSSDSTLSIVEAFRARVPFPVHVIEGERRLGSTASFELVLNACSGDITVLCDQDDVWRRDKLQRIEDEFERRPGLGAVFSNASLIDAKGRTMRFSAWDVLSPDSYGRWILGRRRAGALLTRFSAPGCTLALHRSVRSAILPFPAPIRVATPPLHHDQWLLIMAAAKAPVAAIPDCLVAYRLHSDQQIGFGPHVPLLGSYRLPLWGMRLLRHLSDVSRRFGAKLPSTSTTRRVPTRLTEISSIAEANSATGELFAHATARSVLPRPLGARAEVVGRMWMSGEYHRFARGTTSALADLIRPVQEDDAATAPESTSHQRA
jgi:hypothetical protein